MQQVAVKLPVKINFSERGLIRFVVVTWLSPETPLTPATSYSLLTLPPLRVAAQNGIFTNEKLVPTAYISARRLSDVHSLASKSADGRSTHVTSSTSSYFVFASCGRRGDAYCGSKHDARSRSTKEECEEDAKGETFRPSSTQKLMSGSTE